MARPLPAAAVLALLLASGCLEGDDTDDGGSALVPEGGWAFTPILVGPGGDAETAVLVGPDGLVLACSHGGFGQPSPSWASEDGGDTWRRLDPQPNPVVSGDCDWAVLDDGTWAIVYDTIASATVATSTDRGQSWSLNYASALPVAGVDRPWLASQGNTMYMAYANVMAVEPAINMFAVSRDGGRTWTEHALAHSFTLEESDRPNTIIGHPVVDGSTVRIPLASSNLNAGGPTTLSFAVSRDEARPGPRRRSRGPTTRRSTCRWRRWLPTARSTPRSRSGTGRARASTSSCPATTGRRGRGTPSRTAPASPA